MLCQADFLSLHMTEQVIDRLRKPITISNRTNYFNPDYTRSHITIQSPYSYQGRRVKVEGYESRLYWQFRFCSDHDGQTFFYTLTYKDSQVPSIYGKPCFDYKHLVYLLNGGFKKQLLRKFGTNLKYFVGAELGEGKGKRGLENNPHYHVLFFLEPANNPNYPYVKIAPLAFRHLVRVYWQGFDETTDGFKDYNTFAKFGIAREGQNLGLVTDFRACVYCAKYVLKDVRIRRQEGFIKDKIEKKYSYMKDASDIRNMKSFMRRIFTPQTGLVFDYLDKTVFLMQLQRYDLTNDYLSYLQSHFDETVNAEFSAYRNRYSNKCRISNGVGDYALEFIEDKMNPYIKIPDKKKGFKNRPIGLYYYRKLYTKVIPDYKNPVNPKQPIRVLTWLGREYKVSKLDGQIDRLKKKTASQVSLLDQAVFSDMVLEGYYVPKNENIYNDLTNFLSKDETYKDSVYRRFAEYKLVYENRFFKVRQFRCCVSPIEQSIDPCGDFRRFLYPPIYEMAYTYNRYIPDWPSLDKGYISYSAHPYFCEYIGLFDLFSALSDYFFVQGDKKAEEDAERIRNTQQYHKRKEFKCSLAA